MFKWVLPCYLRHFYKETFVPFYLLPFQENPSKTDALLKERIRFQRSRDANSFFLKLTSSRREAKQNRKLSF